MSRPHAARSSTRLALVLALLAVAPLALAQAPESTDPGTEAKGQVVPLQVLEAELRPMTREEVEVELETWLGLLQEKCIEVSRTEIQAMDLDDSDKPDAIERLSEQAVQQRAERGLLIERVNTVIAVLEQKGGDVSPSRAYVESVIVPPPVSGWRAGWTTVKAWVTSPEGGGALALNALAALAILAGAWVVSRLLARATRRLLSKTKRASELLRTFAVVFVRRTVIVFGLLIALSQFGISMAPMLAAIGAIGLIIGLALQGTLSNFASGLLIMIYRPFDTGDVVNAGGKLGTVEGMTLFTTSMNTFDNQRLSIPNNMIWGDVITNLTAESVRRVDMKFGISYGDDVAKAKEVLFDILKSHASVLEDPEPNVRVHELGDSSVNFIVRPWVKTDDYWDVFWEVTQTVKERFDAEGISIPFPQRDLHVHQVPAQAPGSDRKSEAGDEAAEEVGSESSPT